MCTSYDDMNKSTKLKKKKQKLKQKCNKKINDGERLQRTQG